MAQPITFQSPAKTAPVHAERLRNAPTEHAEAILSAYELLQLLHDRGVLHVLRGLAGAGDQLAGVITTALDTPESIRAIRNLLLLARLFANIPPDTLNSLLETVNAAAQKERTHKAPGLLRLFWELRNEDTRHAASLALGVFAGLGKGL